MSFSNTFYNFLINQKGIIMRIGILTSGGDVPGLNPAIRAITVRANREGHEIVGIKKGWAGLIDLIRDKNADNYNNYEILSEQIVNKIGRTGGTFLHTSRKIPNILPLENVPIHLRDIYKNPINDLTDEIMKNLDYLGIDYLIPICGKDSMNYAVELHNRGVKIIGIPKTMDNDVFGTDYCIGFSTCVTRTLEMTHALRTSAGSHERFLVIEVFGKHAGFTSLIPAMAGAVDRCVIPEYDFDINNLTELMASDRYNNPSRYSVCLVSEGAKLHNSETNQPFTYFNMTGQYIAEQIKKLSPKYCFHHGINVVYQKLGYLVRCGNPDALDSIVPMAFGNIALDLILKGESGRMVAIIDGKYNHVPIDITYGKIKKVNLEKYYNTERLRPKYTNFQYNPFFIVKDE